MPGQYTKNVKEDKMNAYKLAIGTFIITVLGVMLSACGGDEPSLTVPAGAKAGDLNMAPGIYKVKKGMFKSVEYAADRGTLVVSENRSKPDSRLIALPVTRIRATGDNSAEPIFWFTGGPGESNMKFSHLKGLVDNHDIIMVGYRGVDGLVVLDCPEVEKAYKGVGRDLFSDASASNIANSFSQCAKRLQAEGVDLDGYTMVDVVEDIETARIALGYGCVNLLSGSYGTRLAMIYAWKYPDSLYRSVMIAVNPPGHFVWEPDITDKQLEYDAELCAKDPGCSDSTTDLAETMRKVVHNLPRRWLFLSIDPGKVKIITHFMLFHRGMAAAVYDAFIAAEAGDPSGLALMSLMYNFLMPSALTWGDFASKGVIDYDPERDYMTEMLPPDSILGAPASLFAGIVANYGGWPTKDIPAEFRQVQPSDVETLLVNGNIDYSTPRESIDELLPHLSNGQLVILKEFGHTGDVWGMQPKATIHLLSSFYDTGVADDSLYTYQPMNFHVRLGFPEIAKIGLAFVVMVIAGVAVLVWLIVRRVRRRGIHQEVQ